MPSQLPRKREKPTDFGRAVGQLIGLLMEKRLRKLLAEYKPLERVRWVNSYGLEHEIDFVIGTKEKPIVLIDSKYIKYQKHAREKANEIASMLISIKDAHPSVRLLIAVLAGNFTPGSKRILTDRGIHIFHISFETLASNLRRYRLKIDWVEDDRLTAEKTWEVYNGLSEAELSQIADGFFDGINIPEALKKLINENINAK